MIFGIGIESKVQIYEWIYHKMNEVPTCLEKIFRVDVRKMILQTMIT